MQTLKTEENCHGFYYGGSFHDSPPERSDKNKKIFYSKHHPGIENDQSCIFLDVYLRGEPIADFTKDEKLGKLRKTINAHRKASAAAKIDLSRVCIFDLLPFHVVQSWFSQREKLYKKVINSTNAPKEYEILHKAHVLSSYIRSRPIHVTDRPDQKVDYDIYSSATGRFATRRGSFPILNLKRQFREKIAPKNHLFVEFDYNGAEIRTLLALCGVQQPDGDIHDWNSRLYSSAATRDDVKRDFFAWLYNPKKKDLNFEKIYDKTIYNNFYFDGKIVTPFKRALPVEESKALNYLLQSTTSDIVTEKAYNILNMLKNYKSDLCFTIHDSIVLDVHRDEHGLIKQIKAEFERTPIGNFKSNVKAGQNFGNMREILV